MAAKKIILLLLLLGANNIFAQEHYSLQLDGAVIGYFPSVLKEIETVLFSTASSISVTRKKFITQKIAVGTGIGLGFSHIRIKTSTTTYQGLYSNKSLRLMIPTMVSYQLADNKIINLGMINNIVFIDSKVIRYQLMDMNPVDTEIDGLGDVVFGAACSFDYKIKQQKKTSLWLSPFIHYHFYRNIHLLQPSQHYERRINNYFYFGLSARWQFKTVIEKPKKRKYNATK